MKQTKKALNWKDCKPLLPDWSWKVVKDIGMRMMLVTKWCFNFSWAVFALSDGCFSSSYCPARAGWGHKKGTRGDQPGQADLKCPKGNSWPQGITEQENQGKSTRALWFLLRDWLGIDQGWWNTPLCITAFVYSLSSLFSLLLSLPFLSY